jgi:diaminopimelate epimerase
MQTTFYKYQGTGNDFIMIDNRPGTFPKENHGMIAQWCHRRFGIGADGLILLEEDAQTDFKMVYFNADGNEGTMCGNGGRCIVAFASDMGLISSSTTFSAVDGLHEATVAAGQVRLKMKNVPQLKAKENAIFLDTGSPHHVQMVDGLEDMDVAHEGARLRYGLYGKVGSNINFVSQLGPKTFKVRTYERGVEDETLSCGTGVTAVALAMDFLGKSQGNELDIEAVGGLLKVSFEQHGEGYAQIYLSGAAKQVFKGSISW